MMNNIADMMTMLQQIKADPIGMLSKRFNLPQGISKNPQELLQYLLNSGQVSQGQIDQAMQMKKFFMK